MAMTPDYVARLIVKTRAIHAHEDGLRDEEATEGDENVAAPALEDPVGDEEIRGLGLSAQAELVALLLTGRGDAYPEEWPATLQLAEERREIPTEEYLLEQPLVAEHSADGLEKLEIGNPLAAPR